MWRYMHAGHLLRLFQHKLLRTLQRKAGQVLKDLLTGADQRFVKILKPRIIRVQSEPVRS